MVHAARDAEFTQRFVTYVRTPQAGRDIFDLGEALYAFLLRYGEEFDYSQDAVSIESGGIVPKAVLGMHTAFPAGGGRGYPSELDRFMERLTVDCPITGEDLNGPGGTS